MLNIIKRRYKVSGMTCKGCKASVENSLNLLDQVRSSNADIRLGELTLILNKDIDLKNHYKIQYLKNILSTKKFLPRIGLVKLNLTQQIRNLK